MHVFVCVRVRVCVCERRAMMACGFQKARHARRAHAARMCVCVLVVYKDGVRWPGSTPYAPRAQRAHVCVCMCVCVCVRVRVCV